MKTTRHRFTSRRIPAILVIFLGGLVVRCDAEARNEFPSSPYSPWPMGPSPATDYFPIGVWYQKPGKAKIYRSLGINLYVGLWNGPTRSQLNELKLNRMPVICAQNEIGLRFKNEKVIVGWMQIDEPDNAQPRGKGLGYGPPIPPGKIITDYVRMKEADPTRPVFLNLGQGVAWDGWYGRGIRGKHPEDYEDYVQGCDIVSFDIYPVNHKSSQIRGNLWFVAEGLERLKKWTRGEKILWNMIETTGIRSDSGPTPDQVRTEVWMSLIHGSRGIVYFVHSWFPEFNDSALLEDPKMRETIREINFQIEKLAPVLNRPDAANRVVVESNPPEVPIAFLAKEWKKDLFLFTVCMRDGPSKGNFMISGIPPQTRAIAIGEDRTIPVVAGRFEDVFHPYEVHLYRIKGTLVPETETRADPGE